MEYYRYCELIQLYSTNSNQSDYIIDFYTLDSKVKDITVTLSISKKVGNKFDRVIFETSDNYTYLSNIVNTFKDPKTYRRWFNSIPTVGFIGAAYTGNKLLNRGDDNGQYIPNISDTNL